MFRNCGCNNSPRQNFGVQYPMNNNMMYAQQAPIMEGQVIEPTITKCVEQEFYHEVPQV